MNEQADNGDGGGGGRGTAYVVMVVVLAIVLGVLGYFVFRPSSSADVCTNLLPRKTSVGLTVGDHWKVDLGAVQQSTGANNEQIQGYLACLEKQKPSGTTLEVKGVVFPREPIGQLANAWKAENGLQVTLEPAGDDAGPDANRILQNLGIGPFAGAKHVAVKDWCEHKVAACVTCDPGDVNENSNQVIVRLKKNAPTRKQAMEGTYPPSPANPHQPWEDVDEKGTRHYYECEAAPAGAN